MEVVMRMSSVAVALETKIWPAVVAKMALVAQKPLALLLLLICFDISLFLNASGEDTRLPPGEVNGVTKCNAENKDGSATGGTNDQGEEEEEEEEDDDDDMSTDNYDEESSDDDDDDSDSDDDDSDDDDDDDDDEEEEEDGAPGKKKDQN